MPATPIMRKHSKNRPISRR
ncbi:hypothetical protein KIPB_017322, partial [Kipferlia bialata]|eukprot:g17322.t1